MEGHHPAFLAPVTLCQAIRMSGTCSVISASQLSSTPPMDVDWMGDLVAQ
jgi:hypothetical protein